MTARESVSVLGSTGSIGANTLDVIARHPDRFMVHALTGRTRLDVLARQCATHAPKRAVVETAADAASLRERVAALGHRAPLQIDHGPAALCEVAAEADVVMAAIVGAAGLPSAMAAARAGRRVLLANKEALVMAGALFMDAIAASGATLLPIDSEHNAVFQCMPPLVDATVRGGVERVLLTASGGPFRTTPLADMENATPAQAIAHPNWAMGRKISVDSATMMNKGLEVIEARWLFSVTAERIEVVIHPQSVVHSMVSYVDGSVLAQMGNPDMRTPIAHALAYPDRIASGVAPLDLAKIGRLDFERPDRARFPCLDLAYRALKESADAPTILNAANEIAVQAFLDERIRFTAIADVVDEVLSALPSNGARSFDDVVATDARARARAVVAVEHRARGASAYHVVRPAAPLPSHPS